MGEIFYEKNMKYMVFNGIHTLQVFEFAIWGFKECDEINCSVLLGKQKKVGICVFQVFL